MPTIQHSELRDFGADIFAATGLPADQSRVAIDHLVDSNLAGHDSHGVIRVPGYVNALQSGDIQPVGNHKIVRERPASLVVDANQGFGIVMCRDAMQWAVDRAQEHTLGAVAVHNSSHIGRLGDFPPLAAEQDCIGVLMLNGGAPFTAPFGGTGRRLPPNPIAVSVPTPGDEPMVLDMTTSMAAGGKVSVYAARGQRVPDGWLVDAAGNPVTDPERFFGEDPVAMLPMGGSVGHKGYGLAMMVEAIAGGLSWAGCTTAAPTRGGCGYLAMAIKIDSFIDPDEYKKEIGMLIDWVKSSPRMPGQERIYYPGEIEAETRSQREADGILIEDTTWNTICASAQSVGVDAPQMGP